MKKSFTLHVLDAPCSRRSLLKGLGFASVAAVLPLAGCASNAESPPQATTSSCAGGECIDLTVAANAPLTKVGGAMLVDSNSGLLVVIRTSDTAVVALSAICTHAGCALDFDAGQSRLTCPCHGSQFDEAGHVVQGPARTALRVYTATLSGQTITIAA